MDDDEDKDGLNGEGEHENGYDNSHMLELDRFLLILI